MARLIFARNPLSVLDREEHFLKRGTLVIDWLQEHYVNGCGGEVRFFVNGFERPLDNLDYAVEDDDTITLLVCPAGFDPITVSIIVSLALTALSMVVKALMASPMHKPPEPPRFSQVDTAQPSPVYSTRNSQNSARLGEPVPVIYGTVLHTPDYCAQPYTYYQSKLDQFVDILLCLGQGTFDVNQIMTGDTDVATILDGSVSYHIIPPSVHKQRMGNLGVPWAGFYENMISAKEVGEQEFIKTDDRAGFFRLGKSGQVGNGVWVDIEFPNGLYVTPETGNFVEFFVNAQQADESGNPIAGTYISTPVYVSQDPGNIDPLRQSFFIGLNVYASWLVQVHRASPASQGGAQSTFVWRGLRMEVQNSNLPVYGDTTLMAVRLKSTQVSQGVERLIKTRIVRKLKPLGSGTAAITYSPADAFVDMYSNQIYGARRPLTELDLPYIAQLKAYWGTGYRFDAVYTGKTTVWEALSQAIKGVAATPLPVGGIMSMSQEGPRSIRQVLFTEQNIAQDSFKLGYSFDELGAPDGFEIEYRTLETFAPAYAKYPANAVNAEKIILFGCTNPVQAEQYARLMWQRRMLNRRAVTFETDLEGLIPLPGARAGVAHTLPRWGMSGFVAGVEDDGVNITLDRNLKWADVPGPWFMLFRDQYSGASRMVEVYRGASDDKALLSADPWAGTAGNWSLELDQEITQFTWGDATRTVKDFILTEISPAGGSAVSITGLYYAPEVYANTLAFLSRPVP